MMRWLLFAGSVLLLLPLAALQRAMADPLGPPENVYRLKAVVPLPGRSPSWDHLTVDPESGLLYVARRADGVSVVDIRSHQILRHIDGSQGANAVVLVPEFDRGYTANEDGVATVFRLSSLKTLGRIKLGASADGVFYDPIHKLIVLTCGDDHLLRLIDARTGRIAGAVETASKELESVVVDAAGRVYVAERDKAAIALIDPVKKALLAEWTLGGGCVAPVGLALDAVAHRLFVGCRGDRPVLAIVDAETGKTLTSMPLGRGNDNVIYDPATKRILTSNGVEGNIVVFDQLGPDTYRLNHAVTTAPLARTMAYDPKTQAIYTVSAEGLVDPSRPINSRAGAFYPNAYFDDTFKLFIYALAPYKAPASAQD